MEARTDDHITKPGDVNNSETLVTRLAHSRDMRTAVGRQRR